MSEALKLVTFLNLIFVIMLMLAGSIESVLSDAVYYLAFILPIAIGFYASRGLQLKREKIAGVAEEPDRLFELKRDSVFWFLPLAAPAVALVFSVSMLTSLLLSLAGVSSPAVESEGIVKMLLVHAVAPALFEEALFRYIPMKLLMPYSKRMCVFYSAFCFALIHCSFSKMPYAFLAGVIFMLADVALGSVWPSVILHFINNTASVIWIKYCDSMTASWIYIGVLLAAVLISLPFIFKRRREYMGMLRCSLTKGAKFEASYAPAALILICFYIAAANIFA